MLNCPICNNAIAENSANCSTCTAQKGYIKLHELVVGKSVVILLGIFAPLLIALFAVSAQTIFGLIVASSMIVPVLFACFRLIQGPKWFR